MPAGVATKKQANPRLQAPGLGFTRMLHSILAAPSGPAPPAAWIRSPSRATTTPFGPTRTITPDSRRAGRGDKREERTETTTVEHGGRRSSPRTSSWDRHRSASKESATDSGRSLRPRRSRSCRIPPGMRSLPVSLHTTRLAMRLPDEDLARVEHEMILESLDHLWPWFSFRAKSGPFSVPLNDHCDGNQLDGQLTSRSDQAKCRPRTPWRPWAWVASTIPRSVSGSVT